MYVCMYVLGVMATMTQSIDVSVAKQLVLAFGKKLAESSKDEDDEEEVLLTYITYFNVCDITIHIHTYIHTHNTKAELAQQMKEAADVAADLDSSEVR